MSTPDQQSPFNPLPPVVVALFLLIVGIEAVFSLGARGIIGGPEAIGWRLGALQQYAFSGDIFGWMVANGQYPKEHLLRFVSYMFVHASFTHAIFAGVMLVALGKMVGEILSAVATLLVFILAGVGGAIAYGLVLDTSVPLIGAFPGVYGLIGVFTFLLWTRLGESGSNQSRAFSMIGFLIGIQLVFGILFGGNSDWVADVAGFAIGFVVSPFLLPGGLQKIRAKVRRD